MALGVNILSSFDSRGVEKAIKEFSKLETTGEKAQFAIQKAAVPATVALAGLTAAIGFSIKAAQEQQAQQQRLAKILTQTGGATQDQIKGLNAQADALERVGVVSGGNVTVLQSQLATFDLQADTIQRLTPAIVDYVLAEKGAAATAEDFKSMTNGLAQALNGQFGALTRVGFVLDEVTKEQIKNGTEAERSAALVKVLNSTYGGFNESLRDTTAGSMQAFRNSLDKLRTDIGTALLPTFEKLVSIFTSVAEVATRNTGVVMALIAVVGAFSAAIVIASTAIRVHSTFQKLMEIDIVKSKLAFKDAEGAATNFGNVVKGLAKAGAVLGLAETIFALGNAATGAARKVDEASKQTIIAIGAQKDGITENNAEIVANFANTARKIQDQLRLSDVFNEFGRDFQLVVDGVKVNIESADEAFTKFLDTDPAMAQKIIEAMKAQLAVTDPASRAYQDLTDAITRYEKQLRITKGAQDALNGSMADVPATAFKMTAGLNALARQHQFESQARLASVGAIEEYNKRVTDMMNKTGGAAKTVLTAREMLDNYTSALRGNYDAQRAVTSATKTRESAESGLTNSIANVAKAQEYFNSVTRGFSRDSREAISATKAYADAQRRVRDAQISQRDAVLDLEQAEKRLRDLRNLTADPENVADAERKLERAKYGVEETNFSVKDAEQALAELRKTPDVSPIEIRRAEIRLAEAKLAVTDSVNSVRDAEVALNQEINRRATADEIAEAERGLERAKLRVQDASEAVRDATTQEAIAQAFLNQVLNGATEETEEYKKALDALNKAKDAEKEARERVAGAILGEAQAMLALREAILELNRVSAVTPSGVVSRGQAALQGISTANPALAALNTVAGSGANTAPINLTVNAGMGTDGQDVAREIIDVLKQYERSNGYIPITSQYQVAI